VQSETVEAIYLRQVAKDTRVSSQMVPESNKRYQDLHAIASNAVRVLPPPAPVLMIINYYYKPSTKHE
jgi:hypothetical protein